MKPVHGRTNHRLFLRGPTCAVKTGDQQAISTNGKAKDGGLEAFATKGLNALEDQNAK
jgi:hypothetical protein